MYASGSDEFNEFDVQFIDDGGRIFSSPIQEDMEDRCLSYERALEEERRRIITQYEMTAKILRLGEIIPKHLVIRALGDMLDSKIYDVGRRC